MSGLAQVLRVQESRPGADDRSPDRLVLVAVKFCRRPSLSEVRPSQRPGPLKDLDGRTRHIHTTVCEVPG